MQHSKHAVVDYCINQRRASVLDFMDTIDSISQQTVSRTFDM